MSKKQAAHNISIYMVFEDIIVAGTYMVIV